MGVAAWVAGDCLIWKSEEEEGHAHVHVNVQECGETLWFPKPSRGHTDVDVVGLRVDQGGWRPW